MFNHKDQDLLLSPLLIICYLVGQNFVNTWVTLPCGFHACCKLGCVSIQLKCYLSPLHIMMYYSMLSFFLSLLEVHL